MERLYERNTVRLTILVGIIIQLLTLTICYALWLIQGCDPWLPFISDTDVNPKSGLYFTIGFFAVGIILVVGSIQLGVLRDRWLIKYSRDNRLIIANRVAFSFGILSGIATSWLAFTPWHENLQFHVVLAKMIFGGAAIWAGLSALITIRMANIDDSFSAISKMRIKICLFSFSSLILLAVFFMTSVEFNIDSPIVNLNDELGSYIEKAVLCTDLGNSGLSNAAFFEWLMVLGFAGILATFIPEIDLLTDED